VLFRSMTRAKTPVGNRNLWEELIRLNELHDVEWIKVAGHSGDPLNERCDELAREAAARIARGHSDFPGKGDRPHKSG